MITVEADHPDFMKMKRRVFVIYDIAVKCHDTLHPAVFPLSMRFMHQGTVLPAHPGWKEKRFPTVRLLKMNRFFVARYIEQDGTIWRACGSEKQFLPARKAVTGGSGSGI